MKINGQRIAESEGKERKEKNLECLGLAVLGGGVLGR